VASLTALVRIDSGPMQVLWIAAMSFYVVCALTRLGFYNVHHTVTSGFIGLPTTLAAVLWATLFLLHPPPSVILGSMVCIGAGMISRLHVPRPQGSAMVAYLLWLGVVLLCNGAVLSQGIQK
jgi:phosphatidylserine synthase